MSDIVAQPGIGSADKFQIIFDSVGDGIFVTDAETGRFIDVNEAGCAMFGLSRDEVIGRTIEALSTNVRPYTLGDAILKLEKSQSGEPLTFEWRCKAKDGHLFWAEITLRTVWFGDRYVGLAILRDITARKHAQDSVAREARVDVLTGLPNRRDFDLALQREIARCDRYGGPLCVAIVDIDHFKSVNDAFGHQIGDIVLGRLATLLRKGLRQIDYIARWGGDELTILLPETAIGPAEEVLNRLRESVAGDRVPQLGRPITVSFGVTVYAKGDTPEALLKRADDALYRSKQDGRNRVTSL